MPGTALNSSLWNPVEKINDLDMRKVFYSIECFWFKIGTQINCGLDGTPTVVACFRSGTPYIPDRD